MLTYELGGFLWTEPFAPVAARGGRGARDGRGGFVLGSAAAFLVLEAAEVAAARGAAALARIERVGSARTRRELGAAAASLAPLWDEIVPTRPDLVLSGATGCAPATKEEHELLGRLAPGARVHDLGDLIGHTIETQAIAGAAIAAGLVAAGRAGEVVVTSVGHRRGEGLARLATPG